MNCVRRWIRTGGAIAFVALAPACGGGGDGGTTPPPPSPVAQVVITSPASAPVFGAFGRTVQFAADPRDASGNVVSGKTPTWSSNNTAVATVSTSGLVTAVGNGSATISASVDTKTGSLGVTVAQVTNSVVVVTPGTVAFGAKGSTRQLTAEARDSTNNVIAGKTFTWASTNAAVATVSATGLVTSVADGTTQISASVDGQSGNVSVTVAIVVFQVLVSPGSKTFSAAGSQQQFTAVANDSNASAIAGKTFTWSSTNAAVVTVDANGLATSVGNGTAQVQATADAKTGGASVTVDIVVASLTLLPTSRTFTRINQSQTFTPTARDANNNVIASPTLTWVSRNTSFVTVNSSGAATSVADGSTYVVVTATSTGVRDSAAVTVAAVANAVSVTPSSVAFGAIGSTRQLTASVLDSGNTVITGRTVTWSNVTNTGAASVNGSGLVSAAANGSETIRASATGPIGPVTTDVAVTVTQVPNLVVVTPGTKAFGTAGRTQQFIASTTDSNGNAVSGAAVSWSSTNPAAVTVDAAGLATAVANGSAQVQATAGTKTGSASVTVNIVIATLTVAPGTKTFSRIAVTQVFSASAFDSANNPIANPGVTWASRNTSFVTVNSSGVATSVTDGSTYVVVTATSTGVRDSAAVTVAAVANAVSVSPSSVAFGAIGKQRQLSATVLDSGSTVIPGRTVTWSIAGPGTVASVNASGLVTALAVGSGDSAVATTATGPAVSGKAPITVTQVVFSITVTSAAGVAPDTLRTTGRTRQFSAAAADSNANNIPGAAFTWSSTNPPAATVDNTGLVTAGNTDGSTTIQASAGGKTGSRALVVRRYAATFVLTPPSATITTSGGMQLFNGTAQDSANTDLLISWLSRSTGVATVNPATGTSTTATAVGNGTTQIVMSGGTRSDSALVTVSNQTGAVQVGDIFFRSSRNGSQNPAVDTITVGRTVTWTWVGAIDHGVRSTGSPSFTSSVIQASGTYAFTFNAAGTYQYNCAVHGQLMTGRVVVQ